MKVLKNRHVPAREEEILDYVKCDLCGITMRGWEDCWRYGKTDSYDNVNETEVRLKQGYNCPDGGVFTEINVDICVVCFKEKLLPWLISQGVAPQTKAVNW
jgi:hypothetical protein